MDTKKTLCVITVNAKNYRNNLFYDEVRRGINIEANLTDINVDFLFGFRHDIGKFSQASGIIFAPDGSPECKQLIDGIKSRYEVPVVQLDNQVNEASLAPEYDAFVGADNFHGGRKTAEYLATFLPERSSVLVIAGNEDLPFLSYNDRFAGFRSLGFFEVVDTLYGEFSHEVVYEKVDAYFQNHSIVPRAIVAFNDDSAIIARKALENKGIKECVVIAGFDGSAAGRAALSKGKLLCSYDQNPEELGRRSFHLFLDILSGKPVPKITLIKGALLTEKNIGVTFHAGVMNFLDRSLTPFSFRKRRYEIYGDTEERSIVDFKNELICPVVFGDVGRLSEWLKRIDADKFILVSDNHDFLSSERERLASVLSGAGLKVETLGFPGGEENKTSETLLRLVDGILEKGISKKSCLVLVGGGITGNVGGFAASILYRSIRFVHVPTTVMHMVDSSTGGKQAVNSRFGKNSLGNFLDSEFIFIDPKYLSSLPEREMRSGLAECIKHALCQDSDFAGFILEHADALAKKDMAVWGEVLKRTIRLKADIMQADSYELNEGMVLIYGHTIGNAIESASEYSLTHGESVGLGMLAAARLSAMLGIADQALVEDHVRILQATGLPTSIPKEIPFQRMVEFLAYDKKYTDKPLSFVLLSEVGKIFMENGVVPKAVSKEDVEKVIRSLYEKV